MNIHSWLRRVPMPSKIRLDGKHSVLVGQGKNKWRDVVMVIEERQPSMVEALNADGDIIRSTSLAAEGSTEEPSDILKRQQAAERHRDVELCTIVMEAGDRGARRHAEAFQTAFEQVVALATSVSESNRATSEAFNELIVQHRQLMLQTGASGDGDSDIAKPFIADMLGKALRNNAAAPAPAKPNGKTNGHKPEAES